jgi:hypothetical protein
VDLDALRSLVTAREPLEVRGYLARLEDGQPTASGSAVRLLGRQVFLPAREGGLLPPEGAGLPSPADHTGVFLTLDPPYRKEAFHHEPGSEANGLRMGRPARG